MRSEIGLDQFAKHCRFLRFDLEHYRINPPCYTIPTNMIGKQPSIRMCRPVQVEGALRETHIYLRGRSLKVACVIASMTLTPGRAVEEGSSIFGVTIPVGYRQWELMAPAHEAGLDELRAILGNALSMKAYRDGTLPFPDGAILAKLAWKRVPSAEFNGAFVPGPSTTVQIMAKSPKKYALTGGWGFGRFIEGKPVDEAQHKTCIPCHEANVKGHDLVSTRLAL